MNLQNHLPEKDWQIYPQLFAQYVAKVDCTYFPNILPLKMKQARKPRSYASPKLRLTDRLTDQLTGVKCGDACID